MPVYDTLLDALNGLKLRGYTTDFNLAFDKVKCNETGVCLAPSEFEIVEHHRFEGISNPADSSVVYALESKDGLIKGTLVNAYGVYSEPVTEEMLRKIAVYE
jgi:hypothetical protein